MVWQTNGLTCTQSHTDHSHNCPHTHQKFHLSPHIPSLAISILKFQHMAPAYRHTSLEDDRDTKVHTLFLSSTETSINHADFKPLSDEGKNKAWQRNLLYYTTPLNFVSI